MHHHTVVLFSTLEQQSNSGQGRLILAVSRLHKMTYYSRYDSSGRRIGASQRQHDIHKRDIYAPGGIRNRNASKPSS